MAHIGGLIPTRWAHSLKAAVLVARRVPRLGSGHRLKLITSISTTEPRSGRRPPLLAVVCTTLPLVDKVAVVRWQWCLFLPTELLSILLLLLITSSVPCTTSIIILMLLLFLGAATVAVMPVILLLLL